MTEEMKENGRAVAARPIDTFKQMLEKSRDTIAAVLPKHLTPERILKIATVAVSRNPLLMECTPASVVQSVVISSQLGLEAGGPLGHAYLVPYKNGKTGRMEAQFIPGYRGLIDLARRSGQVMSIEAHCVHEKDEWEYANTHEGTKLRHVPFWDGERGPLKRVYAIARLRGAEIPQIEVMSKHDVDKIRAKSKAANSGPWVTDYDEMARKTVVRRIVKYLPLSVEMATALTVEDRAESGSPSFADLDIQAAEVLEEETTEQTRTEQLKNAIPAPPPAQSSFDRESALSEIGQIEKSLGFTTAIQRNEAIGSWTKDECHTVTQLYSAPEEIVQGALDNARRALAASGKLA